jgi:hypothetical protein
MIGSSDQPYDLWKGADLMTQTTPQPPAFELAASRQFPAWLAEQRLSLAFTTYQVGKLFLRGLHPFSSP